MLLLLIVHCFWYYLFTALFLLTPENAAGVLFRSGVQIHLHPVALFVYYYVVIVALPQVILNLFQRLNGFAFLGQHICGFGKARIGSLIASNYLERFVRCP